MASLSDEELDEIIRAEMPGYRLLSRAGEGAAAPPPETDGTAADIEELRRRYLPDEADAGERPHIDAQAAADEVVVTVVPAAAPDPANPAARPKKVIVSAADRKIVGSQG